ncbi:X-box-binding protein 1 [Dirofilaria immitis]|nr:X-box-binding protein 1 [Dirofilaria immitis]
MSLYILHPQSVTTPNYSSSLTKIRNVSTPILPRYCTTRSITVCDRQLPSIRAIPVQNVQRSEKSTTVLQQPIEELLGLNVQGEQPVRKRECLNHLTAEEKQNRRKLKNRVAAQTARDRKKYRASKLEEAVRTLILENRKLREENKCLKKHELLNNNEEREESCSETEISSSNNVPSSSLGSAESIRGNHREICATDGTDSTLQDVDGTALEFERFCSEILSEVDDPLTTSDSTETKSPKATAARVEWIARHRTSL